MQIEKIPSHCLGNRIALSMVSASLLWQLTKSSKVYSLGTRLTLRYSSLEFFMLNFRTFSRHETRYFKILNTITTVVNGILLPTLFWPTVRKHCSCDQEKLLKFEAEVREFSKFLRSLEQFIQTGKGQNNFW